MSSGAAHKVPPMARSDASCLSKHGSRQDSWEIVEGLRGALEIVQEPPKQEGLLLKKRKWPMKGWHKRYFVLEKGILKYAKCGTDIRKGKLHGRIDVGLSVMSIKKKGLCIDLDAEENIYHLKVPTDELFEEWVFKLRTHRVFRQNEIAMYPNEMSQFCLHYPTMISPGLTQTASLRKRTTLTNQSPGHPEGKFTSWLQSSEEMKKVNDGLSACESYLQEMDHLLRNMDILHRTCSTPSMTTFPPSSFDIAGKKEKRTHRRWRSKNCGKDGKMTLQVPATRHMFTAQVPSCISSGSIRLHSSNPNLSTIELSSHEVYPETPDSPTEASKILEDFYRVARDLNGAMRSAFGALSSERERMKDFMQHEACQLPSHQALGLKNTLKSDSIDGRHPLVHQASNESRTSIPESLSEFFDAQEVLLSVSSSENEASDDGSYLSDVSDSISVEHLNEAEPEKPPLECVQNGSGDMRRRSNLPSPSSSSPISLWNILKNNIGKDLSKVAMPVALNEPLNTLQRLAEELEYSELLDRAAATEDPFKRMVYVATFAVSAYASSYYRAGWKPFNPLLGETYECIRPDKGFRFVAEQVSHHPPVSVCHAESKNFIFWEDMRWRNKFWGKSMEIVPEGNTHVLLPRFGDHYEWNKVTSCIHNIISGQKWIEHYGEISIKNNKSSSYQCKVTFLKGKSWSSSINEVEGVITDQAGKVVHKLFGKWHESIYYGNPPSATIIWKPNPMPPDYEQYYGFTQFAMELNELDPTLKPLLPPTDTRFRPDQRLLEEGNVTAAEEQKQRIEELQRDRRRVLEVNKLTHQPRFFKKSGDDTWMTNNTYWDLRKDPGLATLDCAVLW
uniref:Oxysterol-binding protein-related protein 3 n=1 Tax=Paramormyrops kingsleyae TaxID=1676925 RepID=A0A3B3SNU0_9TELE|nr:oxysterol-binding protein-related protein 3-like isoform X2 [Paramormyrops kingsleyae]